MKMDSEYQDKHLGNTDKKDQSSQISAWKIWKTKKCYLLDVIIISFIYISIKRGGCDIFLFIFPANKGQYYLEGKKYFS